MRQNGEGLRGGWENHQTGMQILTLSEEKKRKKDWVEGHRLEGTSTKILPRPSRSPLSPTDS